MDYGAVVRSRHRLFSRLTNLTLYLLLHFTQEIRKRRRRRWWSLLQCNVMQWNNGWSVYYHYDCHYFIFAIILLHLHLFLAIYTLLFLLVKSSHLKNSFQKEVYCQIAQRPFMKKEGTCSKVQALPFFFFFVCFIQYHLKSHIVSKSLSLFFLPSFFSLHFKKTWPTD